MSAVGEQVAFDIPLVEQAHAPEDPVDFLLRHPRNRRKDPERLPLPRQDRDLDVLEDREPGEDVHHLEGAGDPPSADDVWGESADLLALEQDPPRIGGKVPREKVEQRRLPRAVRPDDGNDLPRVDAKVRPSTALKPPNDFYGRST